MRILQLSNKPPYPPNDGSAIAVYNMGCGFIANGVELTLLTINTKKHFKPDELVEEHFKKQSHYTSVYRDTEVNAGGALLNLFSNKSYIASRFYFKQFEEKLISILKKNTFDIVQLESIFMGDYIPAIRAHSKAKISVRTHNIEHLIWQRILENEKSIFKKKYIALQNKRLKQFENKILQSVDTIVPITTVDEKYFRNWGINKPFFSSPTGLMLDKYNVNHTKEIPNSVFHFGSMDWMPNEEAVLWFLENVWDLALQKIPHAKFYVVGRDMSQNILALKKPNVIIVGKSESAELVYQSYSIMVIPLLSGSGMRIKMIEGMAYAKPIVSTRIGAEGIAVTAEKNCLIADNQVDFANALAALLSNDEKRKNIGVEARKFAEQYFTNTTLVKQLIDFYKTII